MQQLRQWITLARVSQWAKNLFLFIPVFFAGRFMEPALLLNTALAFIAFSLVASAVYVLNDYYDIDKDRLHPVKAKRPLASGAITKPQARIALGALLLTGLGAAYLVNIWVLAIIGVYFCMNIAYSLKLKHIALLDITIIAIGFLLRVFAGGMAGDIPISRWLVLMTFLIALFLGLAKRRDEYLIYMKGTNTRAAIEGYNLQFIDVSMVLMGAITIVSYIMYTLSEEVQAAMGSHNVYVTTLFVVLGIMRYLQQTIVFERSGSPTKLFWSDRFLQAVIIMWISCFGVLIYLKSYFS